MYQTGGSSFSWVDIWEAITDWDGWVIIGVMILFALPALLLGAWAVGGFDRLFNFGAHSSVTPTATTLPVVTVIPGTGSYTFPETGRTVTGVFLDYWRNNGGLEQFGMPISDVVSEIPDSESKFHPVQYFERAVFEYYPNDYLTGYVRLAHLGKERFTSHYTPGTEGNGLRYPRDSTFFSETHTSLGGEFLQYWNIHDGISQLGLPISPPLLEKSDVDGNAYYIQYFENTMLEAHPENQPPYDVLKAPLGGLKYREKYEGEIIVAPKSARATIIGQAVSNYEGIPGITVELLLGECSITHRSLVSRAVTNSSGMYAFYLDSPDLSQGYTVAVNGWSDQVVQNSHYEMSCVNDVLRPKLGEAAWRDIDLHAK